MRTTYHTIVGMDVVDMVGERVGRVADLRAQRIDGHLRVTGLLVGEAELLARFGLRVGELVGRGTIPGYFVPWQSIASIEHVIKLSVSKERLEKLPAVAKIGYSG